MKKLLGITALVLVSVLFIFGGTALAQDDNPTPPPVPYNYGDMMGDNYGYMGNGFHMMDFDFMGSFADMMNNSSHMWGAGSDWMGDNANMWGNGYDMMGSYGSGMMGGHSSGMWDNGSDWMNDGSGMGSGYNGMGGYGR